jgi:hypothetical protein
MNNCDAIVQLGNAPGRLGREAMIRLCSAEFILWRKQCLAGHCVEADRVVAREFVIAHTG